MKNKILLFSFLVLVLIFAMKVDAVWMSDDNNSTGGKLEIKTGSEADKDKIQTQNGLQEQDEVSDQAGVNEQNQVQAQQKIQAGSESDDQIQDQNQVKNQGEANKVQTNEQEENKGQNNATVEQRRSQVANAVKEMLQIADRNAGIGQQVKVIAQNQNQNQEKLETSLQKIQSRNGFVKFFIGPNYGEINNAQKILEQNKEQINQLNQIKTELSNEGDAQALMNQVKILEQSNLQIENSLQSEQNGFALLGWMFKLFSR